MSSGRDHLSLFVAAMIWGAGKKNAARMQGHFTAAIGRLVDDSAILTGTASHVRASQPREAYADFTRAAVPGVRAPFFTKWFFAVGLADPTMLKPVIWDSVLSKSLQAFGWDSRKEAGSTRRSLRYEALCKAVDRWATWIGERSDQLELYLFSSQGLTECPGCNQPIVLSRPPPQISEEATGEMRPRG